MGIVHRRNAFRVDNLEFSLDRAGRLDVKVEVPSGSMPETMSFGAVLSAAGLDPKVVENRLKLSGLQDLYTGMDLVKVYRDQSDVVRAGLSWVEANLKNPEARTSDDNLVLENSQITAESREVNSQLREILTPRQQFWWNGMLPETVPRFIEVVCHRAGKRFQDLTTSDFVVDGKNLCMFLEWYGEQHGIGGQHIRSESLAHLKQNAQLASQVRLNSEILMERQIELLGKEGERLFYRNLIPETVEEIWRIVCYNSGKLPKDLSTADFEVRIPEFGKELTKFIRPKGIEVGSPQHLLDIKAQYRSDTGRDLDDITVDRLRIRDSQLHQIKTKRAYTWEFALPESVRAVVRDVCLNVGKPVDRLGEVDFEAMIPEYGKSIVGMVYYLKDKKYGLTGQESAMQKTIDHMRKDPELRLSSIRFTEDELADAQIGYISRNEGFFWVNAGQSTRDKVVELLCYAAGRPADRLTTTDYYTVIVPELGRSTSCLFEQVKREGHEGHGFSTEEALAKLRDDFTASGIQLNPDRLMRGQIERIRSLGNYDWSLATPLTIRECVRLLSRQTGKYPMDLDVKDFCEVEVEKLGRNMRGFLDWYARQHIVGRGRAALEALRTDGVINLAELQEQMMKEDKEERARQIEGRRRILAKRRRRVLNAQTYKDVMAIPPFGYGEVAKLVEQHYQNPPTTKTTVGGRLCEGYLRGKVLSTALMNLGRGVSFEEMISEGALAVTDVVYGDRPGKTDFMKHITRQVDSAIEGLIGRRLNERETTPLKTSLVAVEHFAPRTEETPQFIGVED
ncbi:MAG: hypothetical protein FJY77_05765, partial [Candidatus Altiarchaeales archaeon]|nr:hypothetical protein [Candidatus Altiarchaeales archaeon]